MESTPGLRRRPQPDLAAVESDTALVERIRAEIERDGPITFARFMELALYDPDGGYYRADTARPGREGDFLTAAAASPLFGRALARHAGDVWRALGEPERFTIREHGAGSGALAAGLLGGIIDGEPRLGAAVRYRAVEVEPRRLAQLADRLAGTPAAGLLEPDDGEPIAGLVIANEVLDALPTHRVVARGGALREIHVGWRDGAFVDVELDSSTTLVAARLAAESVVLADGQTAEVCLAVDTWVAAAAGGLERGVLLLVDYGHSAAELYDARRRPAGTLLAYLRHIAHDDVYRAVGRQDLTAHVDVTAVEQAAARSGLDHLATTSQARFLDGLGIGELLVELQAGTGTAAFAAYLEARAALIRMVDPAVTGSFRVMAFGRGIASGAPLRGLR